MTRHSEVDKLLAAFVLAELDEEQTRQVEAHLAECEACRNEVERLETLLAGAGRSSELSVDEAMCEAAGRSVLLAVQNERTTPTRAGHEPRVVVFWRIIMKNSITKLAIAAVVALAVILGYSVFVENSGSTAYAQAVGMLQKACTITFSTITKTGMDSMPTVRTDIAFKEPGYMRTSTADGYICVLDATGNQVKGLGLVPATRNYIVFDISNLSEDPNTGPLVSVEKLQALPNEADEALGRKEIDGRLLEGYRVYEDDVTATVWIDPVTAQLARAEMEFANTPSMNMIMTDFQFDVPLADELFSIEPPAGYRPVEVTADASKIGEQDFIDYLRLWSSWTVDGTFPPLISGTEIAKIIMQMAQEGKFKGPVAPGYEAQQHQQIMYNGMLFVGTVPTDTYRYAGQNVAFGDPATPIFWYRPEGSETYRVIYADLHVADVAPEDLPK